MTFLGSPLFSNLLYLLLVAGVWLAALAIVSPGTGILEVLAFFALAGAGIGTVYVPLNGWALIVLGVGVVLFLLSLRLSREEIWLALSGFALCIGSVFLFRPEEGGLAVHPLLALVVSLMTMGYFWIALRNTIKAHRARPAFDLSVLMGQVGEARTMIDPTGSVQVGSELWTARAETPIEEGSKVRVHDRDGLILIVEPVKPSKNTGSREEEE
jgi:membrane-bound serine protease (ClpP class)